MKLHPLAVALVLVLGQPGFAAADRIDELVQRHMQRMRIPGLSLAIVQEGRLLRARGYGLAHVEHGVLARAETVYQAASVSKQFTAAAILLLAEQGKLRLDAPIGTYLPGMSPAWRRITVRQLLGHTSGLKDYTRKDINLRADYTDAQLLDVFRRLPLDFLPGSAYRYSNTGYVLLGMLIQQISGQHHSDFIRRHIFVPLGMDASRVISEADIIPNRSAGYRLVRRRLKHQEWVAPSLNRLADGFLYTTALDLAKWDSALDAGKVLRPSSRDLMWLPGLTTSGQVTRYGLGWRLREVRQHKVVEHRGSWQGFRAHIVRYVADRLSVVVLANLSTAGAERIAREVAGLVAPGLAPEPVKPIADPEPKVADLLRRVFLGLAAGKLDPGLFTPAARKEFFPDDAEEWHEVLANIGPLRTLVLVERRVEKGVRHCQYVADFGEMGVHVGLTLTPEGQIAELSLYDY